MKQWTENNYKNTEEYRNLNKEVNREIKIFKVEKDRRYEKRYRAK